MFYFEETKTDSASRYQNILDQVSHLLEDETDWLANLANTSSHLFHALDQVNWVGFYLLKEGELVLGPFNGQPACVRIQPGRGVCGTAIEKKEIQRVADVHQFPGHIACDAASRAEIVIPLSVNGKWIGVLDIDSPQPDRFSEEDQKFLEAYCQILLEHTNWDPIL
ncbi:GAF domain-containing protein [Hazenella sp. IB182357]|uniref:GAF domain-containing protein n=1 Tax=Polycladospora coralii TaxID=2771432 RepID=A0A926N8U2_9BACL|nr:GAF domain-containing protein [Polycladospora coralii]MBD1370945.1 GAF domain-containing protein [Polycladospora coralii]MBS7529884.1 GAF domain-containing protein [Polycladospora coralii]